MCAREGIESNTGDYAECPSVHAEAMALIHADNWSLNGGELYLVCDKEPNPAPCPTCQKMLKLVRSKASKGTAKMIIRGKVLMEPSIANQSAVDTSITTRKFDIEHYALTGELKYLDEEGITMAVNNVSANAEKMRREVDTLAKFNATREYCGSCE